MTPRLGRLARTVLAGVALAASAGLTAVPAHAAQTLTIQPGQRWQTVLEKAQPGDTVIVAKGVHPAQRIIGLDLKGVLLQGESRTDTVVQGLYLKDVSNLTVRLMTSSPVGNYPYDGAVSVTFASRNVTIDDVSAIPMTTNSISGFDVSRGGTTAPRNILISDPYYTGHLVKGKDGRGLRIWAGNVPQDQWPTNVSLQRAKFVNSSTDIVQIASGKDVSIIDCYLARPQLPTAGDHVDGIQSYGSDGLVIKRNFITAPGDYIGSDQAIIIGHSSPSNNYQRVTNTTIEGNTIDAYRGQGIVLAGTENTVIRNNVVKNLNKQASDLVINSGSWNYQNVGGVIAGNSFTRSLLSKSAMLGFTLG